MRWALFSCFLLILLEFGAVAADNKETSSPEFGPFPTLVVLDAYGEEPAEYAYWEAWNSHGYYSGSELSRTWVDWGSGEESGTCCPVITRWVYSPGTETSVFRFYAKSGRLIKRVTSSVHVDQYGLLSPEFTDSDHYDSRYSGSWNYWRVADTFEEQTPQPVSYPWPEAELRSVLSGSGPWTLSLTPSLNIPDSQVLSYEWDFDHDGEFGLNSGRTGTRSLQLELPGKYIFSVRVTDLRGYVTTADCAVDVT